MDKLITIATLLFILSLISERISNFLKLRAKEGKKILWHWKWEGDSEQDKKQWDLFVMKLTIPIGILVALLLKADLFTILNIKEETDLGDMLTWKNMVLDCTPDGWINLLWIVIGCISTGLFLSLGSKFWHDLVDLLLQIKNLKKKAVDKEAYAVENIKELDAYIQLTEGHIAQMAIKENYATLKALPNFKNVFVGFKEEKGQSRKIPVLELKDANTQNVPKYLEYTLATGTKKKIQLQIITNAGPVQVSYDPGQEIYKHSRKKGTYGCTVKNTSDQKLYALTCAHVMLEGRFEPDKCKGDIGGNIRAKVKGTSLGRWTHGVQSEFYDYAMIQINRNQLSKIDPSGMKPVPVPYLQVEIGSNVYFKGNKTKKGSGKVLGFINEGESESFQFANTSEEMREMIKIGEPTTDNYSRSISQKGDSGAVLYDTHDRAIGMIVGFNDQFTYAISMYKICSDFKCTVH